MRGKFGNLDTVPAAAVAARFGSLLADVNFQDAIRRYNDAMAFASFFDNGGNAAHKLPGAGPYTYAVHGQVYHSLATLHPPKGRQPAFGQLYFYDPHEATQQRMQAFEGLCEDTLTELKELLLFDVHTNPSS